MASTSEIRTGAYPDKTSDGKDIVYVAMPSIETTEAWREQMAAEQKQRERSDQVGARIQAFTFARDIAYRRVADEASPDAGAAVVIQVARTIESYLLGK